MKKYLITGFSGFVSRHFVHLLEQQAEPAMILGIDVHPPGFNTKEFRHINCEFRQIDMLDKASAENIIFQFQPDYLLHLASYSSVSFSWKNPNLSFQNNTNIFLNILEAIRQLNIDTRILSIGSSEEYGNVDEKDVPLLEDHPLSPVSPYAVARVSQEMLSKIYADGYGIDIIMTRSFNHIGPGQNEIFVVSSFAKQLVEGALQKKSSVEITTGDLSIVRDFLDVRDVVRAYHLLLTKGRKGEVYNVCSGKGISLSEILTLMGKKLNIECVTAVDKRLIRPKDNMVIIGSNQKIYQDLGWKPEISLETSIGDILADWKDRLELHYDGEK